ncbi:MAG: hypothetical protein WCF16_11350 [Alphaproteobacteria bacterium]
MIGSTPLGSWRGARAGWRLIAALPLLAFVSACTPAQTALWVGASAISYIETDKGITDHVMSNMMHKDCAANRLFKEGKMCRDDDSATLVAQQAPVYCYRTLGEISCYASPDPYGARSEMVQSPHDPAFTQTAAGRDPQNEGN